ncbi:hypothetical protein [Paraburkholderia sp. MM6662-R1]|uniref:hypothetical protein n=1 Tax=Paraburkholderia sp. MM6662-R1 TaxID=2991066 RepID=UPI003D1B18C7
MQQLGHDTLPCRSACESGAGAVSAASWIHATTSSLSTCADSMLSVSQQRARSVEAESGTSAASIAFSRSVASAASGGAASGL